MSPSDIRNRVSAVYLKKGAQTVLTGLADLNPPLAAEARQALHIEFREDLILVSKPRETYWAVITGERLVWKESSCIHQLALADIRDARFNLTELRSSRTSLLAEVSIYVVTNFGEEPVIVESGIAACGFLNALLAIAKDNCRRELGPSGGHTT